MTKRTETRRPPGPRAETGSRPDPDNLPARYLASVAVAGAQEVFSIVLDIDSAVVRRRVGGVPTTMVVPTAAFRGIAVSISTDLETMEFELAHPDPGMSLPLGRVADVDEAATILRRWAEVLALPMLVVDDDGRMRPVDWSPEPVPVVRPRATEPLMVPPEGRGRGAAMPGLDAEALVRSHVVHGTGRVTVVPQ